MSSGRERIDELPQVAIGHLMTAGKPVRSGPAVPWQVMGAEEAIEHRHVHGEVPVDGLPFGRAVPVMELRRCEQPPQPAEVEAHVRVDERRLGTDERHIPQEWRSAKPRT